MDMVRDLLRLNLDMDMVMDMVLLLSMSPRLIMDMDTTLPITPTDTTLDTDMARGLLMPSLDMVTAMLLATHTEAPRVCMDTMEVMAMVDITARGPLSQVMVMLSAITTEAPRVHGHYGGYGYGGYYGKRSAEPGYYGGASSFVHQSRPYYHGSYGYGINHYGKRSADAGYYG